MIHKQTIPDVLDRFRAYRERHPSWGALHVVLEDLNVGDDSVRRCLDFARDDADEEGHALAEILLTMSRTQRIRLARIA